MKLPIFTTEGKDSGDKAELAEVAQSISETLDINTTESIDDAYQAVLKTAHSDDLVLVFGSFYTVDALLTFLKFNVEN